MAIRAIERIAQPAPRERMADHDVLLAHRVVEMISRAREGCRNQPETGGILIGSLRGPHIECADFTTAGPSDVHGIYHFTLQDRRHQRTAEEAWSKSENTVSFIGTWHTHPSGRPAPSSTDIASWMKLVRTAKHPMLFLVVAPNSWAGYRITPETSRGGVRPLRIVEQGLPGIVIR